jgi:isopenicillin-N epimerase
MTIDLKEKFMLDPNVIYLNHGSYGACPQPVFERYQHWQRQLELNPMHFIGHRLPSLLEKARESLGSYIGTTGENIVYFANPTTAVRMICRCLCLEPGDEVLTTDWEYPAMDGTWDLVAYQTGATYVHQKIPIPIVSRSDFVETFWKGVTEKTKIIFISHIAAFSALIFPIEEIIQRARQANILTFIDGAHALSQIPLDMEKLDADVYVGACHKWLCSPKGAGFAYAHPRIQNRLVDALIQSCSLDRKVHYCEFPFVPQYQPQGTRDPSAFLSVPEAIKFQNEHNWEQQRDRCHSLALETRLRINALTGLDSLSPDDGGFFGQMISIRLPEDAIANIRDEFTKRNIVGLILNVHNQYLLRVSYQAYNTQQDADQLVQAVKKGLAESHKNTNS